MISAAWVQRQVLTNIQILRFVAAALILVKHSIYLFVPVNSWLLDLPLTAGVDLFFVISGFIMGWLTRGCFGAAHAPGRFLLRRAIRIVPPYWFFTSLMVATLLIAPGYIRHTTLDWPQVAASYAFIPWPRPTDGAVNPLLSIGWTLNYEAFFYVCLAIALLSRRGAAWLALIFIALAAAHWLVPPKHFMLYYYTDPIILEFLAGLGLERLHRAGVRLPLWSSLILAGFALAAFSLTLTLPPLSTLRFTALGLPAIIFAAAFILAPEPDHVGRLRAALCVGGDASYTLYLCHPFTTSAVAVLWRMFGFGLPAAGIIVAVGVSLAAALILYSFIERPITRALHERFGFARPSAAQMVAP